MSMNIANEWYQAQVAQQASGAARNWEQDAAEADAVDEKIYE